MTKRKPKEDRVQALIDAAVAEFVDKGYEGASMESIAARSGLTKGGLYHHFSSKDEILLAANERFMEPVYRMIQEAESHKSPGAGLRGFFSSYLQHWRDRPRDLTFIALTMTKVLQQPAWWPILAKYSQDMISFYRRLLERAVEAGEIAPGDLEARATTLLGAVDGLAAYVLLDPSLGPEVAANRLWRTVRGQLGSRQLGSGKQATG